MHAQLRENHMISKFTLLRLRDLLLSHPGFTYLLILIPLPVLPTPRSPGPSSAIIIAISGPPDQAWLPWVDFLTADGPPDRKWSTKVLLQNHLHVPCIVPWITYVYPIHVSHKSLPQDHCDKPSPSVMNGLDLVRLKLML